MSNNNSLIALIGHVQKVYAQLVTESEILVFYLLVKIHYWVSVSSP